MTEILLERLQHPKLRVRAAATEQLVALGPTAVPRLMEVALASPNPTVQVRALEALGRIGDFRALLPILQQEQSTDLDVAQAAQQAHAALRTLSREQQQAQILSQLSEDTSPPRLLALAEYVVRGPETFSSEVCQPLLYALRDAPITPDDARFELLKRALESLSQHTPARASSLPDTAEGLVRLLKSGDYAVRTAAVEKLALLGDAALPPLEEALISASYTARIRMLEVLGKLATPRALPLLLHTWYLYPEERLEVHRALMGLIPTLEAHPDPALLPAYQEAIRLFRYEPTGVALAAARALVALAQSAPSPRYRAVVPLLKARFFAPPLTAGLVPLGKELDRLTLQWKDLPLVSEGPDSAANLPLASEKDSPARD